MDVFDQIAERRKDLFDEVESDRIGDKVFDEVEKELPALVRSYVKEQTKKIKTLSPREISDLVDKAISNIPEPKPVEKVIEKTIVKQVEKKDTKKYIEESDLKDLRDQIEKLKERLSSFRRDPDIRIVGNMLPNYSSQDGTVLTARNGRIEWEEASGGADAESGTFVVGPDITEGSWRLTINGTELSVQRYESGSWVEKGSFLP